MISITSIEIRGKSERGDFVGRLEFLPGLQVISGPNSFGKSLAAESIAWCLGLEVIFGRKDSDPTFFPEAVLEELDLPDAPNVRVLSSAAQLTIRREDGAQLELTRGITHDRNKVRITQQGISGTSQMTLLTGTGSMVHQATGFQRFLFEWLGWPPKKITTFDGSDAYIYLENLAPLFYIEQEEGWTEIQARQIGRYGQQVVGLRRLALDFRDALKADESSQLRQWIENTKRSPFGQLVRFAYGLQKDISAVAAAVETPWSSGQVEGQINRLKMIKRQMFGRAGFELLRARVLPLSSQLSVTAGPAP